MQVTQTDLTRLFVAMGLDTATGWDADKLEAKVNQEGGIARYRESDTPLDDPELEELYQSVAIVQADGTQVTVTTDAAKPPAEMESVPDAFAPSDGPESDTPTPAPPPASPKKSGKKPAKEKPVTTAAKPKSAAKPAKSAAKPKTPKKLAKPAANGHAKGAGTLYPGGFLWPDYLKHLKKNPLPLPDEGVIRTTYDELVHAGKGKTPKPVTKEQILDVLAAKFEDRTKAKMGTTLSNNLGRLLWMHGVHVWRQKTPDGMGYYIVNGGKEPQPKPAKPTPPPKPAKKAKAKK